MVVHTGQVRGGQKGWDLDLSIHSIHLICPRMSNDAQVEIQTRLCSDTKGIIKITQQFWDGIKMMIMGRTRGNV